MKKYLPVIIVVIAIGAGAAFFLTKKDSKPQTNSNTNTPTNTASENKSTSSFKVVKACDALNLDDAKAVLGDAAEPGDEAANTTTETSELVLTHCTFILSNHALPPTIKNVSLQARSAKTDAGAKSNQTPFNKSTWTTANQEVSGYGDAAYWNPTMGQLNILKNNNWYILIAGPSKSSERTLDEAKKLADQIMDNL